MDSLLNWAVASRRSQPRIGARGGARPTQRRRERLDPEVFRLPVEKIREGYYTDAYFNFTKELLEAEGRHPNVVMQVFQKQRLGARRHRRGDRGAEALLRPRRSPDGEWQAGLAGADGPRSPRGRRDLALRDRHAHRGRLLALRPPRDGLPRLPRAADADHAQRRARSSRRRAASRSSTSRRATTTGWCRPATAGRRTSPGAIGVSTDAQASWWGGKGIGHGPARPDRVASAATRSQAATAFADRFAGQMNIVVLVDFDNDSVRTSLEVAEALGDRLWGVRLDTVAHARRPLAVRTGWAASTRAASTRSWCGSCATALDEAGHARRADRRLRRLQRRADPRVRARAACRSTPTASARA